MVRLREARAYTNAEARSLLRVFTGTLNVLRAAHRAGIKRVVLTSSNAAVYQGQPEKVQAGHVYVSLRIARHKRVLNADAA